MVTVIIIVIVAPFGVEFIQYRPQQTVVALAEFIDPFFYYLTRDFIRRYHSRFPRINEFLQACIAQAKSQGYVETLSGRRRRIVDIDAKNPQQRAAAERLAINSVVQGSAADLIKQAMINIAARIAAEDRPSRMLLQIHDELVFELPADAVDAEHDMIVAEMTGAFDLSVPLKVDIGVGDNWMDAK